MAVLGRQLGAGYSEQLDPALRGLAAEALVAAARQAYIDNMHDALVVAAVVAFVGVLGVMPGRSND